jgi:hypothetical protein
MFQISQNNLFGKGQSWQEQSSLWSNAEIDLKSPNPGSLTGASCSVLTSSNGNTSTKYTKDAYGGACV